MSNLLEPGTLRWNRARLTIDGVTRQVAFHGDGVTFTSDDPTNGSPVDTFTLALDAEGLRTAIRLDGRTFEMHGEDGVVRTVHRAGCACGGG